MDTQSPWNQPGQPPAGAHPAYGRPMGPKPAKLPTICFVVAIVDLVMGSLTLLGAPMVLFSAAVLPEGSPLEPYLIPSILMAVMVGGVAIAANTAMLKKKLVAVTLGYGNIGLTLIGTLFMWVQLPASIESQEMQMASDPNAANLPPGFKDMMATFVVASTAFASVVRITLAILIFVAINKFKAWSSTQG